MKPLEFKIENTADNSKNFYDIIFFYEDGKKVITQIAEIPEGLELNKHYSITDIYGYKVVDDRKGL